jgi:hypothetical protein
MSFVTLPEEVSIPLVKEMSPSGNTFHWRCSTCPFESEEQTIDEEDDPPPPHNCPDEHDGSL